MLYRVGNEELIGSSCISTYLKVNTFYAGRSCKYTIIDRRRFGRMFIRHGVGIIQQLVKVRFANFFIADIDPSAEPWEVDIDPVRIFRPSLKEAGVPRYS